MQSMRRIEILILKNPADNRRWQMINNDKERYRVIEQKFSTNRKDVEIEYACLIIYDEIGEQLPLTRETEELRSFDTARIQQSADKELTFDELFGASSESELDSFEPT